MTSRLNVLRNHPSFPDPDLAPERDVLNCVRVLTRLLPYVYEAEHLEEWEDKFFWARRKRMTRQAQISAEVLFDDARPEDEQDQTSPREADYEDAKPLAEELIDTLVDLLFLPTLPFPGFRLPRARSHIQSGRVVLAATQPWGPTNNWKATGARFFASCLRLLERPCICHQVSLASVYKDIAILIDCSRYFTCARRQGHYLHHNVPG